MDGKTSPVILCVGLITGVTIALAIFCAAVVLTARGPTITHVTTAEKSYAKFQTGGISSMKPKDLLKFLESGDRTIEDLGRTSLGESPMMDMVRQYYSHSLLSSLPGFVGSSSILKEK